ncbi:PaaX family transcriptional regulator [Galbitalea soli]|uniref:PaaX family transcriptional regulator n=2 Tax=Galbitalea soli TaxID=1268042 RepID=A0A7C9PMW2_9MICO|nr:PaaX family transcriptional regulator C-terminal domain-containing protein [Galbitalea soli]NEM91086.1 PaaX family transcriptional regulator [Galbitalea soli]
MVDPPRGSTPGLRKTRTLLLTVLGEAVLPSSSWVWQGTLVDSLVTLGSSVAAARQAVGRAVADDWLVSERVGRRSQLRIADSTVERLQLARQRTMDFGNSRDWDGQWLFVALSVPEESRALRHHFRTELAWLGFGSLGNGLWVSPHTENEESALRLFQSVEGPNGAYVFTGARPVTHSPRELAAAAWDLDELRDRYEAFLERFEPLNPRSSREVFAAWVELLTSWRHFPLFDPELPDSLLPRDWPRYRARQLFREQFEAWTDGALDYFRSLES